MSINNILKKLAAINFFQIEVIADREFEGKTCKNVKQRNNDSFLTPDNWHNKKDIFFRQRLETYKDSYTLIQKIKLEIEDLDNLPTSETDYKILVDNYKNYLLTKLQQPQTETKKPDSIKEELHNNIFKNNAFELFEKYHTTKELKEFSKTDLNLLYQLLKNDNLFVETVELKHYIKWLNKTYGYSLTELKKVELNSKSNIQRTNDYKEYKTTTLKQP